MNLLGTKIGVAGTTSVVLTEALSLDSLKSALISLAVAVLSVLTVEGVNWLKNFIVSHTKAIKDEDEKSKEE